MGVASKLAVATEGEPALRSIQSTELPMWCWVANGDRRPAPAGAGVVRRVAARAGGAAHGRRRPRAMARAAPRDQPRPRAHGRGAHAGVGDRPAYARRVQLVGRAQLVADAAVLADGRAARVRRRAHGRRRALRDDGGRAAFRRARGASRSARCPRDRHGGLRPRRRPDRVGSAPHVPAAPASTRRRSSGSSSTSGTTHGTPGTTPAARSPKGWPSSSRCTPIRNG